MNSLNIKKIFSKVFSSKKEKKFGLHSNLERDWKIIMILFLIINIMSLIYCYYFFYRIISEDIFSTKEESILATDFFDKDKLIKNLEIFKNKEGCSINIGEINILNTKDPSI